MDSSSYESNHSKTGCQTRHSLVFGPSELAVACFLLIVTAPPTTSLAAFHGAGIFKNAVGPDGTPRAHVGDTITATVLVKNLDDFGDSLTITSIFDVSIHCCDGVAISPLLASPVVLTNLNNFVVVTNTSPVLVGDPDISLDNAFAGGFDNHDGPGGTRVRQNFQISFPGQISILRPCIQVTKACANPQTGPPGMITFIGSVTNCGNTLLTNLVVSNFVDSAFVYVLGPISLDVTQAITFTNSYMPANPCQPSSDTLLAFGTDGLGLTVSADSGPVTCFNPPGSIPVRLSIAQEGTNVVISWPRPCMTYTAERSPNLVAWGTAPGTAFLVGSNYRLTNAAAGTFFYRLKE